MNTEAPTTESTSAPFLGPLIGIISGGLFLIVCLILIIRLTRCCGLKRNRKPMIQRSVRLIRHVSESYYSENPRHDRSIQDHCSREYSVEFNMEETDVMSPPSYQMSMLELNNNYFRYGQASLSSVESSSGSFRSLSVSTLQTDYTPVTSSPEPPPPYKETGN